MPYADPVKRQEFQRAYQREYKRQQRRAQGIPERVVISDHDTYGRDRTLRRKYGITLNDYDELVALQCGACAICGVVPSEDPDAYGCISRLQVDHDHATGRVRGLICHHCNKGLGHFRDDTNVMQLALKYLLEGVT